MPKKLTYEQVKFHIEEQSYKLISKYNGAKNKITVKCPNNHIYDVLYTNFQQGSRCPDCVGNKKLSYNQIKSYIESIGYQLISTKYINRFEKLKIKCPQNHIFQSSFQNFKYRQKCPICYLKKRSKYTYDSVKFHIENEGYILLSNVYINTNTKLWVKCNKGHKYKVTYNHFKHGHRCPVCFYNSTSSIPEKEIQEYVSGIYDGKIVNNDRTTIINPSTGHNLELDIYLPDIKKAIEFNGTYWHSLDKAQLYDKIKKEQCEKTNINLLVIQEQLYNLNKDAVLDEVKHFIMSTDDQNRTE